MRIQFSHDEVPEPKLLEDGAEVTVRIARCLEKKDKNGRDYLSLILEVTDDPEAEDIFHMVYVPHPDESSKQARRTLKNLGDMIRAFGMPEEFDTADLIGEEAQAVIGLRSDEQYGDQNVIRTFVVPK